MKWEVPSGLDMNSTHLCIYASTKRNMSEPSENAHEVLQLVSAGDISESRRSRSICDLVDIVV